jgi:cell division protein FtsA
MKTLIAAVDLGTTKIVCTVGERTANGVKVIAYSEVPSKGIERGRVVNVKQALMSLAPAVKAVETQIGKKVNKVFVGIAGQDVKCVSPAPFQIQREDAESMITQQEINDITDRMYDSPFEDGYKVIYAVPQSYNVDNYMSVKEAVGMMGKIIVSRFKLFIGKENSKQLIKNVLQMDRLGLIDLVLEPVASAKAVLTDEEMEVGVALVDIGGGTSDIIIIQDNIIRHAGIIPFGGNSITEDICIGCGISQRQAEKIKRQFGCCFSDYADANQTILIQGVGGSNDKEIQLKTLAKIIQARMEEILEAACWHIEQSGFKDVIRSGMVLTGGGAQIKNITNLANYVTGMEARTACPTSYTIDDTSVDGAKTTAASTAVGLLIHGFQMMEDEAISCKDSVIDFPAEVEESEAEPEVVAAPQEVRKPRLSRWGRKRDKETPKAEETNAPEEKKSGKSKSGGLLGGFLNGANLFSNNFSDEA